MTRLGSPGRGTPLGSAEFQGTHLGMAGDFELREKSNKKINRIIAGLACLSTGLILYYSNIATNVITAVQSLLR